jgi:hypothetical protein
MLEAALLSRKLSAHFFYFFTWNILDCVCENFLHSIYLSPDQNPVLDPVRSIPVQLKQKVAVPAVPAP